MQDAKALEYVYAYMQHEFDKLDRNADEKQRATALADVYMAAHEKTLEVATHRNEKNSAYKMKLNAFRWQIKAGVEGVEQQREAFLDELFLQEEFRRAVEYWRFYLFKDKAYETVHDLISVETFKTELKTWLNRQVHISNIARPGFVVARRCGISPEQFAAEMIEYVQSEECTLSAREKREAVQMVEEHKTEFMFYDFAENARRTVNSPESFDTFKTELKMWIDRGYDLPYTVLLGCAIAEQNDVSDKQFIEECIEYIRSSECPLSAVAKMSAFTTMNAMLRTALGSDPLLYGKTLDNEDFDWESLRGKYVLIKFTATWCGPCHAQIPGLLEAYEKYHDEGFEIISVYVMEYGSDPVGGVKKHVEKEQLPWIILSEALTVPKEDTASRSFWGNVTNTLQAKPQKQSEFYAIVGVPTMILVDKEGKVILKDAVNERLQTKLAEIFE